MLIPKQYGFQKNIFTSNAALDIVSTSFDNIHNTEYTGLVLLDLKKAFDSVSHKILLIKLEHYGIRGPTLVLLKSFLQRQQYVSLNGYESKS